MRLLYFEAFGFPTSALSASGQWVEGRTFLSACLQAPLSFDFVLIISRFESTYCPFKHFAHDSA